MLPDIDSFYSELGERIKSERLKRNISQKRLGNHLDLTRASVINLEKGRHRPSIYQLILIAGFFQMDYTSLVPFKTEKPKMKKKVISKELKNMVTDQEIDKSGRTAINKFLSTIQKQ